MNSAVLSFIWNLTFSLFPVYVIHVLTLFGTRRLIHPFIDLSIMLPLALENINIRECIVLSLLVFYRGASFCILTNDLLYSFISVIICLITQNE